ncbi:MATE family efflux transporter [Leadbettera azotonutricia]|uniref:Multidrug-efflux transporter n=1 Tax=Leadbettera azotonutricia (strain ATCC BAA-888 / DSM 13862 / ZAS-9) TaxID=545695 RepID=F5Y777_LEAAZ|nr:MATE family efflux transporter [Leadbettera azotonutricia]AEF80847.1 MATE efflux family protein [Leadbettera azotonutricia ZAS-9]
MTLEVPAKPPAEIPAKLPAGKPAIIWDNSALWRLIWPLVVEQILSITIGLADTVMVSGVGEHAVSGVSIVDTINQMLIIAFAALATGGAVVVSHYIGARMVQKSRTASRQLMYISFAISVLIMIFTLALRRPMLFLIYGKIDANVMASAEIYFFLSALSYPFLAIYNSAASLFRSAGNSRITMLIAVVVNVLNLGGNALLIYGFGMGVAGAGIATLVSRAVAAIVLTLLLVHDRVSGISLDGLFKVKLDGPVIRSILKVGIPSGVESSMFQLGKILTSRIFASFGTAAMAANAVAASINSLSFMPANAFGIAMLTIVGQCLGAGDIASAKRNTRKLMIFTHSSVAVFSILTVILMDTGIGLFNLSPEAHVIARQLLLIHCVMSPVSWPGSFSLPNALRSAGDARYCMFVAAVSMWTVRVTGSYFCAYTLGLGAAGVWYAMVADWCVRAVFYIRRWTKGRWQNNQVLAET